MNLQELEAEITRLEQERADVELRLSAARERLDAAKREPVRLRYENEFIRIAGSGRCVARIYEDDCLRLGIEPAALAAHICTFGQPAPKYAACEAKWRNEG